MKLLQRNFFAGVFVLIPILVVIWLTRALVRMIWRFYLSVPGMPVPDEDTTFYAKVAIFFGVLVVVVTAISVLGYISKQYIGQKILLVLKGVIKNIPILGSIYSSLDQLFKAIGSGSDQQFSRVVFVEYPRKGLWVVAFVSAPVRNKVMPDGYINLFVPTVPNPTSGFHIMVKEEDVKDSQMNVEQAFRLILSVGISQPEIEAAAKPS